MYAVVQTGGKQYRVSPGDIFVVERLPGQSGEEIEFESILMLDDGETPQFGQPFLKDAKLKAEIVEQSRADKIIVFKKKRRQNYRRKNGHRQLQTVLRVTEIASKGVSAKAAPKKEKSVSVKTKAKTPETN